jgi:lysyl-tRNA synthetase class 2
VAEPQLSDHNEIIRNRYGKIAALREAGIEPFPHKFQPTHTARTVLEEFEGGRLGENDEVTVAGRVMTIRRMGKAAFFHILDPSGRIQVYVRPDQTDEAGYRVFREYLDMGDIVGVRGTVFRTKTGETTVLAKQLVLLTKSVRPLPEKWHGLRDIEQRYRRRYVDLIVNDHVRAAFIKRSGMVAAMRRFLDDRGYLEVETPMLQPIYGGAYARPFVCHHNALDIDLFLRIAPELYHKRLVVGGIERVYEINRNFRNEGISTMHNPEFTMLELYTAYYDYRDTMELVQALVEQVVRETAGATRVTYQGMEVDFARPWKCATMLELVEAKCGRKLHWSEPPKVVAEKLGVNVDDRSTAKIITEYCEDRIEPDLINPTIVYDFPAEVSPLAKRRDDDPYVAERFEVYIAKLEVGNAYSELNDPAEQYQRFAEQVAARAAGDEEAQQMDEDYIRALEYGMPPASGLGIGIDRLAMILTDSPSIRDVIFFPTFRPAPYTGAGEIEELDAEIPPAGVELPEEKENENKEKRL